VAAVPSARRLLLAVSILTTCVALVVASSGGAQGSALTTGVVEIQTRYGTDPGARGAGTGMVLTSSGQVLTNNHVIRGATQIRVRVPQTQRTYRANVLGYSISADVALLRLAGASGLETVALGNSSTVEVGDDVSAVGNAGGTGRLTVKDGIVTARGVTISVGDGRDGTVRLSRLIETSADLERGDSGGPLLDASGRVIGVNAAATAGGGDSDGYAIPINRARSIAARIRTGDSTAGVHVGPTPFLGILVGPPRAEGRGILLAGVRPGSPAALAGLGREDVLLSLNGTALRTSSQLVALLLRFRPGDTVRVVWLDELGGRMTARVILASGPPQ
jgi:S1-C subfamily serine protease